MLSHCTSAARPSSAWSCPAPRARRHALLPIAARRHSVVVHAQEGGTPPPSQQQQDDERRLEALEAAAKARKGVKAEQAEAMRPSRPAKASSSSANGMAEWKEGQLFPEGWEEMDPFTKVQNLYMGKRGFLYWATQSAYYSVGGLLVGWALFRFVGPALGLYSLTNDLSTPNYL